jgi:hypothetical protein
VFPPPGHDVLVVPRPDRAVSHDFAGVLHPSPGVSPGCSPLFLRRRTRGLVASRCRSWGSTRFLRWGGGAGPEGLAIADDVSYRSHAFTLPRVDFTPLGGFPPLAAFRCCHRQTTFPSSSKRVTRAPCLRGLSRFRAVLRGFAPRAGPYRARILADVRWPTLPGPCSPSRSLHRFLRSDGLRRHSVPSSPVPVFTDPFGGVPGPALLQNRAPCRVPSPCIRGPSRLGTPAYSSRVCLIRRMKLHGAGRYDLGDIGVSDAALAVAEPHLGPSSLMGQ